VLDDKDEYKIEKINELFVDFKNPNPKPRSFKPCLETLLLITFYALVYGINMHTHLFWREGVIVC
jgi:hypothetical protein